MGRLPGTVRLAALFCDGMPEQIRSPGRPLRRHAATPSTSAHRRIARDRPCLDARHHLAARRPLFPLRGPLAGCALLAAVVAIELSLVAIDVLINQWNNRFYNALQDRNWDAFVSELTVFLPARGVLHRARGLSALPQPVAPDPLAALDDQQPISATGSTAPTTTACSFSATPPTIPTSASPKTSSSSSKEVCPSASDCSTRWSRSARSSSFSGSCRRRARSRCSGSTGRSRAIWCGRR